jgi:hypothetical protein
MLKSYAYLLPFVSPKDHFYQSLREEIFVKAAKNGILPIVKLCLELGMSPDANFEVSCPLIQACVHEQVEVVRYLIQAGGDSNLFLDYHFVFNDTLLINSFRAGHISVVRCIIEETMALGIQLNTNGLSQKEQEIVAQIQREVENDRRLRASAAVVSKAQGPSLLAADQKADASAGEDDKKTDNRIEENSDALAKSK